MIFRQLYRFLSSIRLTVVLLALSIVLIFFGTLDQVQYGVYHTQQRYFEGFIAIWQYPPQWVWGETLRWLYVPLPGGYILGPLLLLNLVCAHFRYFRPRWSKTGVVLIHAGVVLMLLGQLITQVTQREYFMWLDEGGAGNYIESLHHSELVVADVTEPGQRREVTIPTSLFESRRSETENPTFTNPALPFRVEVLGYLPNSVIIPRSQMQQQGAPEMPYDKGIGANRDLVLWQQPQTFKSNERNIQSAVVRLTGPSGPLGTWLVSDVFRNRQGNGSYMAMFPPQTFEYQGRTFEIGMRYAREYLPASIELLDFSHDRYPGTDIPLNFSSRVRIVNDKTGEDHQTLIYMNHPLRYAGYTFYQASFAQGDSASMFQVVSNPARWLPYVSSGIISLGMVVQFIIGLGRFANRRRKSSSPSTKDHASEPVAANAGEGALR